MADFHQILIIFSWNGSIIGQHIQGGGGKRAGVGWVVAKAEIKKQVDTSGRV